MFRPIGIWIAASALSVSCTAAATCCWSAWGDSSQCGIYNGSGGKCNSDFSASCVTDSDCRPVLPSTVIAGYTAWATADKILEHVQRGANVIFWSFIELKGNDVVPGPINSQWVGSVHNGLVDMGRQDVLHFASIGGWNQDHNLESNCGSSPCTGAAYAASFRLWNEQMKAAIPGFAGFAGIDWDLEGNDDPNSSNNHFTLDTYKIMLSMSQELRGDFLVSLVPGQSSFNCLDPGFDTSLLFPAEANPDFKYAAKNAYAVLYAKCPDCFDLVMVQIYEVYSPAGFYLNWNGDVSNVGQSGWPRAATQDAMKQVVSDNMRCLVDGWEVDFSGFWGLQKEVVSVPSQKVVIGLATPCIAGAFTSPQFKVPYFSGTPAASAWCDGTKAGERVRGFAYWSMVPRDGCSADELAWVGDLANGMTTCAAVSQKYLVV